MVRACDQQRVKQLLTEAVTLLLKDNLSFSSHLRVEGLIGVTLDKHDVLLFSINETLTKLAAEVVETDADLTEKQCASDGKKSDAMRKRSAVHFDDSMQLTTSDVDDGTAGSDVDVATKQRTKKRNKCKKSAMSDADADDLNESFTDVSADCASINEVDADKTRDDDDIGVRSTVAVQSRTGQRTSSSSNSGKPHQCDECGKVLSNTKTLRVHMRIHTNERPYECAFCGKRFRQLANVKCHMTSHTGEDEDGHPVVDMSGEQEGVSSPGAAGGQFETVAGHSGPQVGSGGQVLVEIGAPGRGTAVQKLFACVYCDRQFPYRSGFVAHMKSAHDTVVQ